MSKKSSKNSIQVLRPSPTMLDPIVSIRLSDLNKLVQQASVSSLHYSGMPSITIASCQSESSGEKDRTADVLRADKVDEGARLEAKFSTTHTRLKTACNHCHESKKSCDESRPCQRCFQLGQELAATCVDHLRQKSGPKARATTYDPILPASEGQLVSANNPETLFLQPDEANHGGQMYTQGAIQDNQFHYPETTTQHAAPGYSLFNAFSEASMGYTKVLEHGQNLVWQDFLISDAGQNMGGGEMGQGCGYGMDGAFRG